MRYFFLFILIVSATAAFSQTDSVYIAPYKRHPTVPPLQLLLADSTTKYTKDNLPKKKPVLVMMFNPDCDHCQHSAEEMVQHKDDFKDIHVVMVTTSPIYRMAEFAEKYKIKELPNVVVGKDMYYLLPPFYDMKNFPFLGLYDKKGNLIEGIEGSLPVPRLLQMFRDNK